MGKRSDFARRPQDAYFTPPAAVEPLFAHLPPHSTFIEPCAGDGALIRALESRGHVCVQAFDLTPAAPGIEVGDALTESLVEADFIITNPPWTRQILHPMIERFRRHAETWLLFDADWMHTRQAAPYMEHCEAIVSIGRVKWIPGSKSVGKDNVAAYRFSGSRGKTVFYGR